MKLIIAGSRDYHDQNVVFAAVGDALACWFPAALALSPRSCIDEVISGKCPTGVDPLGELWAAQLGIPVKPFPADWNKLGNAAGPIRNGQMAAYAAASETGGGLVAIWRRRSSGTASMIRLAKAAGLKVAIKEVR